MSLACFNQFFWPDTAATGQYLIDVVEALGAARPNATLPSVVCGSSPYGETVSSPPPPARIFRAGQLPFQRGRATRVASYGSYILSSWWRALRLSGTSTALTMTTPPLLSLTGNLMRTLHNSRHVIWEMDVYPDVAVDLGVFRRGSIATLLLTKMANWSRHRADAIIALGDDMKQRLVEQGIPSDKIHVCENWADGREITPLPFPDGPLHVHYSGNFGLAHDVATIRDTMLALKNDSRFRFTFAGGGSHRPPLQRYCNENGISAVQFAPYAARPELSRSLAEGHIGLVTQKPETRGSVVPSKTYGIMAAGRPILYIGPRNATPARIIERFDCGWHVEPGDKDGLCALLAALHSNRELIYRAGARAREAFEKNYDRPIGVARILDVLFGQQLVSAASEKQAVQQAIS